MERIITAARRRAAEGFWAAHDSKSYGAIPGKTREVGSGVDNVVRLDGTVGSYNFGVLPRFFWTWWNNARKRVHLARCLVRAGEHVRYRRKLLGVRRWLSNAHDLIKIREELRSGAGKAAALWRRRSLGAFVFAWRELAEQRAAVRRRVLGHLRHSLLAKATRRWRRHTESRKREKKVASAVSHIVEAICDEAIMVKARSHYKRRCFPRIIAGLRAAGKASLFALSFFSRVGAKRLSALCSLLYLSIFPLHKHNRETNA